MANVWTRSDLERLAEELAAWEREHLIPGAEGAVCRDCGDFIPAGADCGSCRYEAKEAGYRSEGD